MYAVDLNVGNGEKPVTLEDVRKAVRADLESLTRMADERNFQERALAFDGMRQACLADKPDMDNLYVKYYLAYLH